MALEIQEGVDLTPLNTFGVPAKARALVIVHSVEEALVLAEKHKEWGPYFFLGGGSNILFTRDVEETLVKVEIPGREVVDDGPDGTYVEAGAGEEWHPFVAWTLSKGFPGLENLALIPGTVGGAPVQNIGAYGLELKDRFHSVEVLDVKEGTLKRLFSPDLRFGYRHSLFKEEGAKHLLILRVGVFLPKPWVPVLEYPDLRKALASTDDPTAEDIFSAVMAIRRHKLPDPAATGNAGSFFKNPVVDEAVYQDLLKEHPGLPGYAAGEGKVKLSAAWIIDRLGWKGKTLGRAGVAPTHALVLVNVGGATGQEILELALRIREDVERAFGIRLEFEPTIY
ncbi:MAG: UDP-N-acetylmuramate dehydrogenase [Clostridiales bacterium]|nr:UDP-N-acetylmuramate dehydrogenase [Clostridiales bacterium]